MKTIKRISWITIVFCFLMVGTAWANEWNWETTPGHHDQSVLLEPNEISSSDAVHQYGRGEYLAEGSVEIINNGNGEIYIGVYTYSYVNADRIVHQVFLEYWDEDRNDWAQVNSWTFEKTREESNGYLAGLTNSLTVTGYETGLYYRVKGLHGVEYNDEFEACATRTDGVLITD